MILPKESHAANTQGLVGENWADKIYVSMYS